MRMYCSSPSRCTYPVRLTLVDLSIHNFQLEYKCIMGPKMAAANREFWHCWLILNAAHWIPLRLPSISVNISWLKYERERRKTSSTMCIVQRRKHQSITLRSFALVYCKHVKWFMNGLDVINSDIRLYRSTRRCQYFSSSSGPTSFESFVICLSKIIEKSS